MLELIYVYVYLRSESDTSNVLCFVCLFILIFISFRLIFEFSAVVHITCTLFNALCVSPHISNTYQIQVNKCDVLSIRVYDCRLTEYVSNVVYLLWTVCAPSISKSVIIIRGRRGEGENFSFSHTFEIGVWKKEESATHELEQSENMKPRCVLSNKRLYEIKRWKTDCNIILRLRSIFFSWKAVLFKWMYQVVIFSFLFFSFLFKSKDPSLPLRMRANQFSSCSHFILHTTFAFSFMPFFHDLAFHLHLSPSL